MGSDGEVRVGASGTSMLLAFVPIGASVGAMGIAYWVYHFTRPTPTDSTHKKKRRRRKPRKNDYVLRTSHLDTSGSVLASWETTPSDSMLGKQFARVGIQ